MTYVKIIQTRYVLSIVLTIVILLSAMAVNTQATNLPVSSDVMSLLNGQVSWYVPHVYQGDYDAGSTSAWPVYFGPNNASQYWAPISTGMNQPILMMVPSQPVSDGAMFWQESYAGNQPVTITLIGTFSTGSLPSEGYVSVADGFEVYLFITPSGWGISPQYNYSVPYEVCSPSINTEVSPVQGEIILPQSTTQYIMVQWNPFWQYGHSQGGATGQWNVWVVSTNSSGFTITPSPSPSLGFPYSGWDGVGNGYFQPNPGDIIEVTVTYDPTTNTLTGTAEDLNTGQSASFTLNLNGYFNPPQSGNYVFGVGANTGGFYANWGLLYVNYSPTSIKTYTVTFVESGLPQGTTWSVTLDGETLFSSTDTISFSLPNGVYYFTINNVTGYYPSPSTVKVTVNNANVTVYVTFKPVMYNVEFIEYGLPSNTLWSVTFNGITKNSTTNTITFTVPAGTYTYNISPIQGYVTIPPSGVISIYNNTTVNVYFALMNKSLPIYSEISGYFFSGVNIYDNIYVEAPPSSQLIAHLDNSSLNFAYNGNIGMWETSIDTGVLPSGVNELTVVAVLPNGTVLVGSYNITVLELQPPLSQLLSFLQSRKLLESITINGTFDYWTYNITFTLIKHGLYNNQYDVDVSLERNFTLSPNFGNVPYIGGKYSIPLSLGFDIELSSSGDVEVSGSLYYTRDGNLSSIPIEFNIGEIVEGDINIANYNVHLEDLVSNTQVSAFGSYTFDTPWGITIPYINTELGLTVTLGTSVSSNFILYFKPINNPSSGFLGIPSLKLSYASGFVGIPFTLTGNLGVGSWNELGAWVYGQGGGGFGIFFYPQPTSYALLGYFAVGYRVVLLIETFEGDYVLFEGTWTIGNVTQNDINELTNVVNQLLASEGYPALPDWINGSTVGIVASGLPNGYTFWSVGYDNSTYVYYTEQLPSGFTWISGYEFVGLNMSSAPLPPFHAIAVASPILFTLPNDSLAMIWAAVPSMPSNLSNLSIILQMSIFNGTAWGEPVNITSSGIVYGYYANGNYVYVLWTPSVSQIYSNVEFRIYSINGTLIYERSMPNAYNILGGIGEEAVVLFYDGIVELVSPELVKVLGFGIQSGVVPGTNYFFTYNGTVLTMFNNTGSIEIPISGYTVWPIYADDRFFIGLYNMSYFTIYLWNGTSLIPLREYSLVNVTYARAAYSNGYVYFFPYQVNNLENGTIYGFIVPTRPPTPVLTVTVSNGSAGISWSIPNAGMYNITSVELLLYKDGSLIGNYSASTMGNANVSLNGPGNYEVVLSVNSLLGNSNVTRRFSVYELTFSESGLPSGAEWGVVVNGTPYYTTGGTISLLLGEGTYSYSVMAPSNYTATPNSGIVSLMGNEGVSITFSTIQISTSTTTNTTTTTTSKTTTTKVSRSIVNMTTIIIITVVIIIVIALVVALYVHRRH